MKRKGFSVFRKLFFSFMLVGTLAICISGVVNYRSKTQFVQHTISADLSERVEACSNLFLRTYAEPIRRDLRMIESSPSVDAFLASKKNEIFLTKPQVERLFLSFTGGGQKLYLSMRLIDGNGVESVITEAGKRVKRYTSVITTGDDAFYGKMGSLFEKLKKIKPGSVLTEGPFMYGNNQTTFLAGIPKREPEIGGFGGAVIVHCDLTGYLDYLSKIRFNDMQIACVMTPDNHVLCLAEKESSASRTSSKRFADRKHI